MVIIYLVHLPLKKASELRGTFGWSLIKIAQRIQKIWSGHEIQGLISWHWPVILILGGWVMCFAHCLNERNIWMKFNENTLEGTGYTEQTRIEG